MQIEPNFEINISLNGSHYCRVELGPVMPDVAEEKTNLFKDRFSEEEGFKVTLYMITCYSKEVTF